MTYSIAANAKDPVLRTFSLIKIDFVQTDGTPAPVYWTTGDFPVVTGSPARVDQAVAARWTPIPFQVGSVLSRGDSASAATFAVGNGDNSLSPIVYMVGYRNPVGSLVHLWEAFFDPVTTNGIPDDSTKIITAGVQSMVTTRKGAEAWVQIVLCPPINLASKVMPARSLTQKCTLTFKSAACQYTGADTACLRTLIDCTAKSNSTNYGGFPMLPAQTT